MSISSECTSHLGEYAANRGLTRILQISRIFSVYPVSFVGYPLMFMIFTVVHLIYAIHLDLHYL